MIIPLVDLKAQYRSIQPEIAAALAEVLEDTAFIKGPHLAAFEEAFACHVGTGFAIGASSGTTALHLALAALEVGPGDEVILPSLSFFATVEPVLQCGARPVFADIDPDTFLIDPLSVKRLMGPRTRALLPVHLYGQVADMPALLELSRNAGRPVAVVEDCAQAHGAALTGRRAGSWGDVGCFSFYPGKNLGAYGDGGALTTSDARLAERLMKLGDHGRKTKYVHDLAGYNYRLDALQAAVLSVKLRHLSAWNDRRRLHAHRYDELLAGVTGIVTPKLAPDRDHAYHLYVVRCRERNALREHLRQRGVETGVHYPVAIHEQPALQGRDWRADDLTHTERATREILSLPMYPELTETQLQRVVGAIESRQALPARRQLASDLTASSAPS